MSNKLVSVCINAYNAEKYILKTIDSVINQSYKNLQIIVVDDCSTDDTYNLVKSIDDDRIELYKTPINGHMSYACNETFKHIKGDYVAHLDADDLWTPDKIEKQVKFLEENSEYGACFTHADIIDESDVLTDESQDFLREIYAFDNRSQAEFFRFFFDHSNRLCHCSALIRSEIVKQVGQYDVSILFLQDFDYWMRLVTVCNIYILPERLTLVRRHDNNNSEMDESKWVAHNNESVRIIYNSINLCPDDLFLKAFADKLRIQGEHTHKDVELEKAFILLEGPFAYKENPILGIYKFEELFKEEKYVKIAAEKFNFTTRDLYKIQQTRCFIDIKEHNHLVGSLDRLNNEHIATQNHVYNLENQIQGLENHSQDLEKHCCNLEKYNQDLEKYTNDLKSYNQDLQNYNDDLNENNHKQNIYIKSLESQRYELTTKLNDLQNNYNNIRNMFAVKIILFIKRLFKR